MSKSIFVFKTPKSCDECQLYYLDHEQYKQYWCCKKIEEDYKRSKETQEELMKEMFKSCPLKPLPERKEELPFEETIIKHRLPSNAYATSIQLEKAILVVNVDDKYLDKEISVIKFTNGNAIFCSETLKPLPQEKYVYWKDYMQPIDKSEEQTNIFNKGYNHWLKEILGEQDNE